MEEGEFSEALDDLKDLEADYRGLHEELEDEEDEY